MSNSNGSFLVLLKRNGINRFCLLKLVAIIRAINGVKRRASTGLTRCIGRAMGILQSHTWCRMPDFVGSSVVSWGRVQITRRRISLLSVCVVILWKWHQVGLFCYYYSALYPKHLRISVRTIQIVKPNQFYRFMPTHTTCTNTILRRHQWYHEETWKPMASWVYLTTIHHSFKVI